jgi:hypothetical protein
VGGQLLQPDLVVAVQAGLVVVDENRCRNVHRVDEYEAIRDSALVDALLHVAGNVDRMPVGWGPRTRVLFYRFSSVFLSLLGKKETISGKSIEKYFLIVESKKISRHYRVLRSIEEIELSHTKRQPQL